MQRSDVWKIGLCASFLTVLPIGGAEAAAQNSTEPVIQFGATQIRFAGRIHTQINTTSVDSEAPAEMILRRLRIGVDVRLNDVVSARIHPEFAGSTIGLGDAYAAFQVGPSLEVRAGRAHRPFGAMEETTSLRITPIERGVRIRGVRHYDLSTLTSKLGYGDRDVGLQVRGEPDGAPLGMNFGAGIFNGPIQGEAGSELTLQYVARAAIEPIEGVTAGVAWSRRDFAAPAVGGGWDVDAGNAFLADFEFGGPTPAPGLHIVAQASAGAFDPFSDRDFAGAQVWTSYLIPMEGPVSRIEPLFRVSHLGIDDSPVPTAIDGGTLFTPGVNFYFGGLQRIMLNYDVFDADIGETESSFKAQFQVTF